jgi:enoyl-CoA hydratase
MCLALASDVILANETASFTPSFINIGLSGGEMGTSYFLPRAVGMPRAAEILLTGRTVGAAEAERIGLINRLVPETTCWKRPWRRADACLPRVPLGCASPRRP